MKFKVQSSKFKILVCSIMFAYNSYSQTASFTTYQKYRIQNTYGYADFGTSNVTSYPVVNFFTGTISYVTLNSSGSFPFYDIATDKQGFAFDKNVISKTGIFSTGGTDLKLGFVSGGATPVVTPAVIIRKTNGKVGIGHSSPLTIDAKLDVKVTGNMAGLYVNTTHTTDWVSNTWLTVNRNNSQALKISNSNYDGVGVYADVFRVMGDGNTNVGNPNTYPTTWAKINIYANKYQSGLNVSTSSDNVNMECIVANVNNGYHKAFVIKLNGTENFKINGSGDFCARGGKIMTGNFPDYVFNNDYQYMNYQEKEIFLKTNKHLPYLPSALEIEREGLDIGNVIKGVTQNVEENTLDILAISKELELLKKQNKQLQDELNKLKNEK